MKQDALRVVGLGDAAESNRAFESAANGKHDVAAFEFGEFREQGARRVAQAAALHPAGEGFPQHVGEEAHQDVGSDPRLVLVPHRTQLQFVFGDAEGPFRLGQLDVATPEGGGVDAGVDG